MAIWIQALSYTLIYALAQGFVVYAALWLVLKLAPGMPAKGKYCLSLAALTILLVWFAATGWQQFQVSMPVNGQSVAFQTQHAIPARQQIQVIATTGNDSGYRAALSSVTVIFPWLSAAYLIGLALMLVRLSAGMLHLSSLGKSGTSQPAAALNRLLILLKNRLHLHGHIRLLISAKAQIPMVIGFLKPVILIPAATVAQLSMEQLETILLHELAHIKRHDYLVNILQTVIETILFFNPFVWMISAIIRREREHCCDDLVLDHTHEPLSYATALAALATTPGTASTFAVAASGQSNHLFNRIKRIMETKKNSFSYSRMVAAVLIITTITCSVAWLVPSVARPRALAIPAIPEQKEAVKTNEREELRLIKRLSDDHIIDLAKGSIIEKKGNSLYIDGQQITNIIAGKYLSIIKQEKLDIQVHPFRARLMSDPKFSTFMFLQSPSQSLIRWNNRSKAGAGAGC